MIKGHLTKLYSCIYNDYYLKSIINLINKHNFEIIFDISTYKGKVLSAESNEIMNINYKTEIIHKKILLKVFFNQNFYFPFA